VKISTCVVSDAAKLRRIENEWNKFVSSHSANPFLLSGFVKEFIKTGMEKGWAPMLLVLSVDNVIAGIAPLAIKTKFGVRLAKFLLTPSLFPDFVLDAQYRTMCIDYSCDFLFREMKCELATLTLSQESPILESLRNQKNLLVSETPAMGHLVLHVECDWSEFEKSRGKKFRQDFRRAERNLDRLGSWRIRRFSKEDGEFDIFERILRVELNSWKEEMRVRKTIKQDSDLISLWEGASYTAEAERYFEWFAWFLELDALPIAYVLAFKYKGTAYVAKTSYDRRYRRLSPGIYVLSTAIRDLFKKDRIEKIDFLTDLPFVRTWTVECSPRVHVFVSKHKMLLGLLKFTTSNRQLKSILVSLSGFVPFMQDSVL
jgi:CelD/BcsL family acetyltransferase involved in cellulose biosynthesis